MDLALTDATAAAPTCVPRDRASARAARVDALGHGASTPDAASAARPAPSPASRSTACRPARRGASSPTARSASTRTSGALFLPMQCMHCAEPPCVPVCPTGASRQRDGRHRLGRSTTPAWAAATAPWPARTTRATWSTRPTGYFDAPDAVRAGDGAARAARRHDQVHLLQGARGRRAGPRASRPAWIPTPRPCARWRASPTPSSSATSTIPTSPRRRRLIAEGKAAPLMPECGTAALRLLPGGVSHDAPCDMPAPVELIPAAAPALWGWPAVVNFSLGGLGAGLYVAAALAAALRAVPGRPRSPPGSGPLLVLAGFAAVATRGGPAAPRAPRALRRADLVDVARAVARRRLRRSSSPRTCCSRSTCAAPGRRRGGRCSRWPRACPLRRSRGVAAWDVPLDAVVFLLGRWSRAPGLLSPDRA